MWVLAFITWDQLRHFDYSFIHRYLHHIVGTAVIAVIGVSTFVTWGQLNFDFIAFWCWPWSMLGLVTVVTMMWVMALIA